jgi:hypothetical protein
MRRFARWVFALTLGVCAQSGAQTIDAGFSGSWFNTAAGGHGINLEVLSPSQVALAWYVFDGQGVPLWLVGAGAISGNRATVSVSRAQGMTFGSFMPAPSIVSWGTVTLTFSSCGSGTMQYTSTQAGFGSGTFPISRLTAIDRVKCGKRPASGLYQGFVTSNLVAPKQVAALLDESGAFAAIAYDATAIYFGNYATSGSTLTVSGTGYAGPGTQFPPSGATQISFSASGSFVDRDSASVNYSGGGQSGAVSMGYDGRYDRGASFAAIAGQYTSTLPTGATFQGSISSSGQINGSDTGGCQYSGNISIPNSQFNAYALSVNVSACGANSGTYAGVGTLVDRALYGDRRSFFTGLRGPQLAIVAEFVRP